MWCDTDATATNYTSTAPIECVADCTACTARCSCTRSVSTAGTSRSYLTVRIVASAGPVIYDLPRKERPPRRPFVAALVEPWHERREPLVQLRRPLLAALPRGKVRRWRSLKEKRQSWGIA